MAQNTLAIEGSYIPLPLINKKGSTSYNIKYPDPPIKETIDASYSHYLSGKVKSFKSQTYPLQKHFYFRSNLFYISIFKNIDIFSKFIY